MRSLTNSIFGAAVLATMIGVLVMVVGTWGIWALPRNAPSGAIVFLPALIALLVQSLLFWATMKGRGFSPVLVSVATALGLATLLIVGGIMSEVVHCRFDQMGCINL